MRGSRPGGVLDGVVGRVDVAHVGARQAGDTGGSRRPVGARNSLHRLEVAGRGDREAGLDHVDPELPSWWAISSFSWVFSEIPGDCSPSRNVVSKISTRSGSCDLVMSLPGSRTGFFGAGFAATCGRRRAIPPEGGGEEVEGRGAAPCAAKRSNGSAAAGRRGSETLFSTITTPRTAPRSRRRTSARSACARSFIVGVSSSPAGRQSQGQHLEALDLLDAD